MKKLVRKTLSDTPITPAQRKKLAKLAAQPESNIDLSEIPEFDDTFWRSAVRNPGKGQQTRLNDVLRKAMLEDLKRRA